MIDGYVEFESLMGGAIAGEARGVDGEDVLVVVKVALPCCAASLCIQRPLQCIPAYHVITQT